MRRPFFLLARHHDFIVQNILPKQLSDKPKQRSLYKNAFTLWLQTRIRYIETYTKCKRYAERERTSICTIRSSSVSFVAGKIKGNAIQCKRHLARDNRFARVRVV